MDVEKLIEQLKKSADFEDYPVVASFAAIIEKKYLREAATALSTLQAENEKLRAEVESLKKGYCAGCSIPAVKAEQIRDLTDAPKLRAELEQVKRENDALWIYIEIVDREYQRYMDRGYIDRLDELKRTWRRGPKKEN